MDVPRCYSIAEASRATSLHRAIIMAAIHAGELAAVQLGTRRYVTDQAILAWLERWLTAIAPDVAGLALDRLG